MKFSSILQGLYTKGDLFLECKVVQHTEVNQCNTPHQENKGKKTHDHLYAAAAAKSLQSCPTLCDPIDGSPPGSPVAGILQARTLQWVSISFSNA